LACSKDTQKKRTGNQRPTTKGIHEPGSLHPLIRKDETKSRDLVLANCDSKEKGREIDGVVGKLPVPKGRRKSCLLPNLKERKNNLSRTEIGK